MSTEEKPKVDQKEKNDLIDTNVSLILAENNSLKVVIAEKDALIVELTKKLQQATDLIEEDTKSRIITEIKEKTTVPNGFLINKSVEELTKMKEVLDTAVIPAFKSGTPILTPKEDPRVKLDSLFGEFAKATWRKNQ